MSRPLAALLSAGALIVLVVIALLAMNAADRRDTDDLREDAPAAVSPTSLPVHAGDRSRADPATHTRSSVGRSVGGEVDGEASPRSAALAGQDVAAASSVDQALWIFRGYQSARPKLWLWYRDEPPATTDPPLSLPDQGVPHEIIVGDDHGNLVARIPTTGCLAQAVMADHARSPYFWLEPRDDGVALVFDEYPIDVRVLDAAGHGLPGAAVTATYGASTSGVPRFGPYLAWPADSLAETSDEEGLAVLTPSQGFGVDRVRATLDGRLVDEQDFRSWMTEIVLVDGGPFVIHARCRWPSGEAGQAWTLFDTTGPIRSGPEDWSSEFGFGVFDLDVALPAPGVYALVIDDPRADLSAFARFELTPDVHRVEHVPVPLPTGVLRARVVDRFGAPRVAVHARAMPDGFPDDDPLALALAFDTLSSSLGECFFGPIPSGCTWRIVVGEPGGTPARQERGGLRPDGGTGTVFVLDD